MLVVYRQEYSGDDLSAKKFVSSVDKNVVSMYIAVPTLLLV